MSDLISKSALIEEINNLLKSPYARHAEPLTGIQARKEAIEVVRDLCVKEAPVVYDTEAVAAEAHMTEHETLLRLQYMYDSNNSFMVGRRKEIEKAIKAVKEVEQYRAIGTVEDLKALKEKAEPKKVKTENEDYSFYVCDNCGIAIYYTDMKKSHHYCLHCGQKLDWE